MSLSLVTNPEELFKPRKLVKRKKEQKELENKFFQELSKLNYKSILIKINDSFIELSIRELAHILSEGVNDSISEAVGYVKKLCINNEEFILIQA